MKFSPMLEKIPDYPFRKVGKMCKDVEQRDGVKVINARIGIPDKEAPQSVKIALAKAVLTENSTFGYPVDVHPERGITELTDAIIKDYKDKYGTSIKTENIAVIGWAKEALFDMPWLFDEGTIYIPDPVYPVYEIATTLSGHKPVRVPTSKASKWLPDFKFNKADKPVAFYFCDPNNPTGTVASEDFYKDLAKKMKTADVCGIFDKAYKDYIFDPKAHPVSITQFPEIMERGYELVSLSKHYNYVGIGLAWIVSSEANINMWLKHSGQHSQGVEWYKQKAGADTLNSPVIKAEMQAYMDELKQRRDVFTKGLRELGLTVEVPATTPYLWIKSPAGFTDEQFALEVLISKAHVAFMPGSYFGASGSGYMRATLFLSIAEIEEALKRIKKVKNW
ncbi:MAG TPA: pyridoxal phosphate-dependent aminotransferase [Dehalococcoidales bacterium]|nr:pyridoxal phosphate-dependent aminotransferase [Dehalococcoidales bacterium]